MSSTNERFAAVMAARKGSKAILELFGKLKTSDKFTDTEKPLCYSLLMAEATNRVASGEVPQLLSAIKVSGAVRVVRAGLTMDDADISVSKVVKRVLSSTPLERDPLLQALDSLEASGVCENRGHIFAMACCANMDIEKLDKMCDLTF